MIQPPMNLVIAVMESAPRADLPWSVHAAAVLALIVGVVIWLAGGRLMRPAFIALGALAGATLAHLLPADVDRFVGEWMVIGIGAFIGALAGWLAFRVLVANTLAIVVSVVCTLAVAAFVQVDPARQSADSATGPETTQDESSEAGAPASAPRSIEEWILSLHLERLRDTAERSRAGLKESLDQAVSDDESPGTITQFSVERGSRAVKALAGRTWEQLVRFWNDDLDPRGRALILLSLCVGYLGGLVLGFALPKRAAAVTTAMIGPAVWMPAAAFLAVALGLPVADRVSADPLLWLAAWGAFTLLGLGLQLLGARRRGSPVKPG